MQRPRLAIPLHSHSGNLVCYVATPIISGCKMAQFDEENKIFIGCEDDVMPSISDHGMSVVVNCAHNVLKSCFVTWFDITELDESKDCLTGDTRMIGMHAEIRDGQSDI